MSNINLYQNGAVSAYEEMEGLISLKSSNHRQKGDAVVCPKPRRIGVLANNPIRPFRLHISGHQPDVNDSKAGAELLDIIFNKGDLWAEQVASSSPPFFCGSPPSRAANPLVQDVRFGDEKLAALPTLQISSPSSLSPSARKAGCVRMKFGLKPASVRVEGFDCLNRDRQNSSIPTVA